MLFILIWRSAKGLGFIQFDKVEWVLGQNLLQYVCRIVALLFLWFAIMSFFPAKLASQHHMMKSCLGENTKAMFACWTSLVALWWPAWGMEGLNHRAMVRNDWIFKTDLAIQNTVDGRNPAPVEVGGLSHDLQGFLHTSWCRISAPSTAWPICCCCNVDEHGLFSMQKNVKTLVCGGI